MKEKIHKTMRDNPALRWGVLLLSSLVMFFNYYFYDALSPLKDLMQTNLGFSSSDYGAFMSAYSVPNVFLAMAVLGGIILDKLGIRITGTLFVFMMALGGVITAYGASDMYLAGGPGYALMNSFLTGYSPSLKMMYLGFFIFGLGAETSIVVLSKIVVKWFKGKELALALGLNLAIGRLGTALALFLSPYLIHPEWTNAIWFGVLLLWLGLLFYIIYIFLDLKIDKQVKETLPESEEDQFRWRDLLDLITNRTFIFITLLCVTFYSAVFPFVKYAPDLLMNKFGMERDIAGQISSILMFGTILLTPLFGWIADNKGKSATLMYLGSALLIISHLMFALTTITPLLPIFLLGVAFSLVPAAMWPAVTKIVGDNKLGTAYGFMFSVQNIGLWALPILVGVVLDASNPEFRIDLKDQQFKEIQHSGNFESTLNTKSSTFNNKDIKFKYVVYKDSLSGEIVYRSYYETKTGKDGNYSINLKNNEMVDFTNFDLLQIPEDAKIFIDRVKSPTFGDNDTIRLLETNKFQLNENNQYIANLADSGKKPDKKNFDAIISIKDAEGRVIYSESQKLYMDKTGKTEIKFGFGELRSVNYDALDFKQEKYVAEIIEPLDYTNAMLMFSALGLLGILFAFLLKRDDKVSGYGLEQPNIQK
ncbi:MFS transporter [Salinivirga cyanobacteriivorans]